MFSETHYWAAEIIFITVSLHPTYFLIHFFFLNKDDTFTFEISDVNSLCKYAKF